ncbi:MAG: 50S ribosomal protein L10 [Limnochordia bacterium]
MVRPKKKAAVEEIVDKMTRASSAIVTDYRGLTVKSISELRRRLRESGAEYKVVKNTLTTIAAKEAGFPELEEHLAGPTAIAFAYEDPVAPAKVLSDFAKESKILKIKAGILEGSIINADGVQALADLPPREVLLGQVVGTMQAPISGFVNVLAGTIRNVVYALDAVRRQKEEAGA